MLGIQLQVNKVVPVRQTGPAGVAGGAGGMGGEGGAGGVGGGRGGGGTSALKGVDKKLAMVILDEVLDSSPGVAFEDIVGLALILKSTLCSDITLVVLKRSLCRTVGTFCAAFTNFLRCIHEAADL